jgi:hypothetical protein
LQSLYCTIRGLFVLFVDYSHYSSTIRGLFALFVDYSRTIRNIRRLFADYSSYSSTIRTIRFTILVLSIAPKIAAKIVNIYKRHLTNNYSIAVFCASCLSCLYHTMTIYGIQLTKKVVGLQN